MNNSSRHHYIPQFYINGFTNEDNIVYVYDKLKDKIWNKQISPKGIFFEWDRNTIVAQKTRSSIIEDYWFKRLDNECSDLIKRIRDSENVEDLHNLDNVSKMQFFLIHLYWRIPKQDFAFDYLFDNATTMDSAGNKIEIVDESENEVYKKLERINLPNIILKEITNQRVSGGFVSKLFGKPEDVFLLGDYPMLYRKEPKSIDDIVCKEVLFPISSNRLYCISNHDRLDFDFRKVSTLNTLIIDQSAKYVCSPSKDFLEKSVDYYKKQKQYLRFDYLRAILFE